MDSLFDRTSVTVDEAVAILLGVLKGPIKSLPLYDYSSDEERDFVETLCFSLPEYLEDKKEQLESDIAEAKIDKKPPDVIAAKHEALLKHKEDIDMAKAYLCTINDELNKGATSALRVDLKLTNNLLTYITVASLDEWFINNGYSVRVLVPVPTTKQSTAHITADQQGNESDLKGVDERKPLQECTGPCWTIDSRDLHRVQNWYTPARYFARQLVKENPTLIAKKDLLAKEVVALLTSNRIFKRGGKLPFDPGTVKKAFVNVILN
jgi:hypothetical protein